jgi:hypothetical protein
MKTLLLFSTALMLIAVPAAQAQEQPLPPAEAMTPVKMLDAVLDIGENVEQQGAVVQFTYEDVPVVLVFDPEADRMRLISPIMPVIALEPGMLAEAMQANFHKVLDVRYAISDGMVWSAFIHPLGDLSDELLRSAIHQVAVARVTFGGEYSSGVMVFGGGNQEPPAEGQGPDPKLDQTI